MNNVDDFDPLSVIFTVVAVVVVVVVAVEWESDDPGLCSLRVPLGN